MKLKLLFILILLAGLVCISPVAAKQSVERSANHLYLYEKDSTWAVVDGGAWGKMMYKDDMFVFNGHGLTPNTDYALINYVDPWGEQDNPVLGYGETNRGGNVNINGDMITLIPGTVNNITGIKIWLVPTSNLNINSDEMASFNGWHPTEYLFEENLI
jgi:hypothetical protein